MKNLHAIVLGLLATTAALGSAWAEDRAARSVKKNDGDGYLTVEALHVRFSGSGGSGANQSAVMLDGQSAFAALDEETLCAIGRGLDCDIRLAVKRGLFETGLRPRFPENLRRRGIDEHWAIDYTAKRDRVNYHGGIDMPAPFGMPMIAAAAGTGTGTGRTARPYRRKPGTLPCLLAARHDSDQCHCWRH